MTFSVLVTYSNRLCHLHCPSYHAKLKIIVLSTVLDSLTLAQEITDNLQFLILRDAYAHLGGDLQNSATYTLSRKASILENLPGAAIATFPNAAVERRKFGIKSSKMIERDRKKEKLRLHICQFHYISSSPHYAKNYISALIMKSKEFN